MSWLTAYPKVESDRTRILRQRRHMRKHRRCISRMNGVENEYSNALCRRKTQYVRHIDTDPMHSPFGIKCADNGGAVILQCCSLPFQL